MEMIFLLLRVVGLRVEDLLEGAETPENKLFLTRALRRIKETMDDLQKVSLEKGDD